ncbi:unnamed protein product, partial [Rotaria sp. Silwood1]
MQSATSLDAKTYDEDLNIIRDNQEKFGSSLEGLKTAMQQLEDRFNVYDTESVRLDNKIDQQRQDLEHLT